MIGDLESCNFFSDKFCVTHNQPEKECRKKAVDEWDLLRLKYESLLSHFREGFGKHGFHLHPGLTPEENAKEWADERDRQLRLNRDLQQLFSEVATMFELTSRQDIDGLLRARIQEALAGVVVKRNHEKAGPRVSSGDQDTISRPGPERPARCVERLGGGSTCGNELPCSWHS